MAGLLSHGRGRSPINTWPVEAKPEPIIDLDRTQVTQRMKITPEHCSVVTSQVKRDPADLEDLIQRYRHRFTVTQRIDKSSNTGLLAFILTP